MFTLGRKCRLSQAFSTLFVPVHRRLLGLSKSPLNVGEKEWFQLMSCLYLLCALDHSITSTHLTIMMVLMTVQLLRGLHHARASTVKKQAFLVSQFALQIKIIVNISTLLLHTDQHLKQPSRHSSTTVERFGYGDSQISSCMYSNCRIQL